MTLKEKEKLPKRLKAQRLLMRRMHAAREPTDMGLGLGDGQPGRATARAAELISFMPNVHA